MAAIREVFDVEDPRLCLYTRLREVERRTVVETEHGVFIAEGHKLITRALAAGHTPVSVLTNARWLGSLTEELASLDVEVYVAQDELLEQVTGFHVHRGALALFERPAPTAAEVLLDDARRLLVLEDLADHTNVGAIFRTAAALSWDGIVLSPRCADPWYRRSLKVSMGAVLTVPSARVDDWYDLPDLLARHGFMSVALTLGSGAIPVDEVPKTGKVALLVGSEGHGLTTRWEHGSSVRATIPMAPGIDSLNVAASVAVAAWELRGPDQSSKSIGLAGQSSG